jgi:uncharacterized coiled-coil DUF342 family protein
MSQKDAFDIVVAQLSDLKNSYENIKRELYTTRKLYNEQVALRDEQVSIANTLRTGLDRYETNFKIVQEECNQLRARDNEALERVEHYRAQVKGLVAAREGLLKQVETLQENRDTRAKELENVYSELDAHKTALAGAKNLLKMQEAQKDSLIIQRDAAALALAPASLRAEIETLKKERDIVAAHNEYQAALILNLRNHKFKGVKIDDHSVDIWSRM